MNIDPVYVDLSNYKGIFFDEQPGQKYQDEKTGAHFEYSDICRRLIRLQKSLSTETPTVESSSSGRLQDSELQESSANQPCTNFKSSTKPKIVSRKVFREQRDVTRNIVQTDQNTVESMEVDLRTIPKMRSSQVDFPRKDTAATYMNYILNNWKAMHNPQTQDQPKTNKSLQAATLILRPIDLSHTKELGQSEVYSFNTTVYRKRKDVVVGKNVIKRTEKLKYVH